MSPYRHTAPCADNTPPDNGQRFRIGGPEDRRIGRPNLPPAPYCRNVTASPSGYQSSIDPRPILIMIGAEAGIGLFERPTVMSHPSYAGWFSFLLRFAPRLSGPVNLLKTVLRELQNATRARVGARCGR